MQKTRNKIDTPRVIGAIILSIIGILGSVKLKVDGIVSELTLVVLIGFSLLLGIFIAYSDRIKELNFKELKFTLKEIKETEDAVRELAHAIVLLENSKPPVRTVISDKYDPERHKQALERLLKLTR